MSSYNRRSNYNNHNGYGGNQSHSGYNNNQRNSHYDYSNRNGRPESGLSGNSSNGIICSFYSKIGACRHGNKCSRTHIKPETSKVVCLLQMYDNPRHIRGLRKMNKEDGDQDQEQEQEREEVEKTTDGNDVKEEGTRVDGETGEEEKQIDTVTTNDIAIFANEMTLDEGDIQNKIDAFYKDVFIEIGLNYGKIQDIVICENVNNHLSGNVYVKFYSTEDAAKCVEEVNDKWYNGRPVFGELSPVINLEDAICRAYENGECDRGGLCNFMHAKNPSGTIKQDLIKSQEKYHLNK